MALVAVLVLVIYMSQVYCQTVVQLNVDWATNTYELKTETTLQVVVNALLTRQSPIHDEEYQMLSNLNANHV